MVTVGPYWRPVKKKTAGRSAGKKGSVLPADEKERNLLRYSAETVSIARTDGGGKISSILRKRGYSRGVIRQ